MKPAILPIPSWKLLLSGLGVGMLFTTALCVRLGGAEPMPGNQVPVPVTPMVPAPVPPAGHHLRYQDLLPNLAAKAAEQTKVGNIEPEVETGPELNLGECIAIALERSPNLKAAKASIAALEASYKALMEFGTAATIVSPDLEIRKQQAQRGLAASAGEYQKAHNEVIQDVTRMYYTVVYAKQQGALAADTVDYLVQMALLIEEIINGTVPFKEHGLTTEKLRLVQMGVVKAKQLRLEALVGRKRALAALRQAMGVDDSFIFRVKDAELPLMAQQVPITRQMVVEQSLCRRPELALAAAGLDVFRLEVYAQGKIPFKRIVPTFASGADLHAKEIPAAVRIGKEYRPGGIIPEMPVQLVGSKVDRVARAMDFAVRAEAVYESARGLITLEAENAFYEFELANENLILAKQGLDHALDLQKRTRERANDIKEKDQIVQVTVATAKVQSEYIEAVYNQLLSLAALERITAGGIRPAFPGR